MKKLFTGLIIALALVSGYSYSQDIRVISKHTVGLDHRYDFKARFFRLCIGGNEFVQSFAVCPFKGSVDSQIIQVFESVNVDLNGSSRLVTVPKKCD